VPILWISISVKEINWANFYPWCLWKFNPETTNINISDNYILTYVGIDKTKDKKYIASKCTWTNKNLATLTYIHICMYMYIQKCIC
jgi:hypothetical protein